MAQIWPKRGPHKVLQIGSSWILVKDMLHAKFSNSGGVLESPFLRNGKNMAPLWPKHGPNMVPQIGDSIIITDMPRDVLCPISH